MIPEAAFVLLYIPTQLAHAVGFFLRLRKRATKQQN
jgi:hypothetical protein